MNSSFFNICQGSSLRTKIISVFFCFLLFIQDCQTKKILRKSNKSTNALFYVGLAIGLAVFFLFCTAVCRQAFPGGPDFSSIDLDEIRLERLDDIEHGIMQNIKNLQKKLTFHRNKKETIKASRDAKLFSFISESSKPNEEHQGLLGRNWENESPAKAAFKSPVRSTMPLLGRSAGNQDPDDIESAQNSATKKSNTARSTKSENPSDLWQLWNKVYQPSGTAPQKEIEHKADDSGNEKDLAYKSIKYRDTTKPQSPTKSPIPSTPTKPKPSTQLNPLKSDIELRQRDSSPNPTPTNRPPPRLPKLDLRPLSNQESGLIRDDDSTDIVITKPKPPNRPPPQLVARNNSNRPPPPRGPPPGYLVNNSQKANSSSESPAKPNPPKGPPPPHLMGNGSSKPNKSE